MARWTDRDANHYAISPSPAVTENRISHVSDSLGVRESQELGNWEQFIQIDEVGFCQMMVEQGKHEVRVTADTVQANKHTDASGKGFRATLELVCLTGSWDAKELKMHSKNKELLATIMTMKHFQEEIRRENVLICFDSLSTVVAINKQEETKSWSLTE